MSRFIDIQHDEWVAAGPDVVRAHYTDLDHRQVARVHPCERLRQLPPGPTGPRYECLVRRGWRLTRDVYQREHRADGSIVDTCVAGSHWGRAITARFWRRNDGARPGTLVELTVTQPLRPVVGALVARWIRRRVEQALRDAAREDKLDVERGYELRKHLRVA